MNIYQICFCLSCFTMVLSTNDGNNLSMSHSNLRNYSNINNVDRRILEGEYVKDIMEYPFVALISIVLVCTYFPFVTPSLL